MTVRLRGLRGAEFLLVGFANSLEPVAEFSHNDVCCRPSTQYEGCFLAAQNQPVAAYCTYFTYHEVGDQFVDFAGELLKELGSVCGTHDLLERPLLLSLGEVLCVFEKRTVFA
jgi:hypothetical protein